MDRDSAFVVAFERMCENAVIRRELLWIRANEKEDLETARDLEAYQPGLRERMAELVAEFVAQGQRLETPRERRDGFARLYEQRLEYWTEALAGSEPRRSAVSCGRIKV
jgi:hypothetical protein